MGEARIALAGRSRALALAFCLLGLCGATSATDPVDAPDQKVVQSGDERESPLRLVVADGKIVVDGAPRSGEPVLIKLPDGSVVQVVADSRGRATIDLPDDVARMFPLAYVVKAALPSGTGDPWGSAATFPADAGCLPLLPPSVKARADALAEAVRRRGATYKRISAEPTPQLQAATEAYRKVRRTFPVYMITGEIVNWDDKKLVIWGRATGEVQGEGRAIQNANLIVQNYNKNAAARTGYSNYAGLHVYLRKINITGNFGQPVPARVYGSPPPPTPQEQKAKEAWERAKAAYDKAVADADAARRRAEDEYLAALPTDPYGVAPAAANTVHLVDVGASHAKGPANAPVTIIAFADFECPFCARAEKTLRQIEERYPGVIRFVFKNRILKMHLNAPLAARAALAAGDQGRFWEMHDRIFANQPQMGRMKYIEWAGDLGLDVGMFTKAMDDGSGHRDLLATETAQADALGIAGIPTFLINGRMIHGAQPIEKFQELIDEELAKGRR